MSMKKKTTVEYLIYTKETGSLLTTSGKQSCFRLQLRDRHVEITNCNLFEFDNLTPHNSG